MSKQQATREEIKALAADGWRFRVKERKGILYISARRGKKEKGLGSYSDEFWAMIEEAKKSLTDKLEHPERLRQTQIVAEGKDDPWIKSIEEIKRWMSWYRFMNCLHIGADGFCDYWSMKELPKYVEQLRKKESDYLFKKVNLEEGEVVFWAFRPVPSICNDCPAFIDELTKDFINSRNKRRVKRPILAGLYYPAS
jgi:hypothetical protein